jgi:hypothetical protein
MDLTVPSTLVAVAFPICVLGPVVIVSAATVQELGGRLPWRTILVAIVVFAMAATALGEVYVPAHGIGELAARTLVFVLGSVVAAGLGVLVARLLMPNSGQRPTEKHRPGAPTATVATGGNAALLLALVVYYAAHRAEWWQRMVNRHYARELVEFGMVVVPLLSVVGAFGLEWPPTHRKLNGLILGIWMLLPLWTMQMLLFGAIKP